MSLLVWVLGPELLSSGGAILALNPKAISPTPFSVFLKCFFVCFVLYFKMESPMAGENSRSLSAGVTDVLRTTATASGSALWLFFYKVTHCVPL